jgi:hypothetical protein
MRGVAWNAPSKAYEGYAAWRLEASGLVVEETRAEYLRWMKEEAIHPP